MANITERRVSTIISISYSLIGGDTDHLFKRELHKIKDETLNKFVTVMDVTTDVGEKDDYRDLLQDESDILTDLRNDAVVTYDDSIEVIDEQIVDIDSL